MLRYFGMASATLLSIGGIGLIRLAPVDSLLLRWKEDCVGTVYILNDWRMVA